MRGPALRAADTRCITLCTFIAIREFLERARARVILSAETRTFHGDDDDEGRRLKHELVARKNRRKRKTRASLIRINYSVLVIDC